MKLFARVLFLCAIFSVGLSAPDFSDPESGQIWALLIAGSDTWMNYRHQADVCHSYQVLHSHGIPDERIVVMMTDDLATSSDNPTPGVVINHPNGEDVYKGVPHDYTGKDVTPENFMSVLKGNKAAMDGIGSGKVIQSGPNDHIFVYFADHGAVGLIAFPESELTARQLNETISYLHNNNRYKKMVLYIEACESGSMFSDILPNNINVYATTAANPSESSYACYYDEKRETYLGDLYSVNWMEDSDKEDLAQETLIKQFQIVKNETNLSHVQEYGDLTIGNTHVSEFQGKKKAEPKAYAKVAREPVRSRDVALAVLQRKMQKAQSSEEFAVLKKKLYKVTRNRQFLTDKVKSLLKHFSERDALADLWNKRSPLKNYECYDEARQYFQEECFEISKNHFVLDYMYVLINLCEHGVDAKMQREAMEVVCTHPPVHGIE